MGMRVAGLALDSDVANQDPYKFDTGVKIARINCHGHSFACIGRQFSSWHGGGSGAQPLYLRQGGDLTIVNPDREAPIAYLEIMDQRNYCRTGDTWRDSTPLDLQMELTSSVALSVFPRTPLNLVLNGPMAFADLLAQQVPHASFVSQRAREYVPLRSRHLPHAAFVASELGGKQAVAEWGVFVLGIGQGERALEQFLKAPSLSENQDVRDGFRELLDPLLNRKDGGSAPRRHDAPLLGLSQRAEGLDRA